MIDRDNVLDFISQLDGKSQIEFAIKQGGSRYHSLQVKQFGVARSHSGWMLLVVSAREGEGAVGGTVADLRKAVQMAPDAPLESIKIEDGQGNWAWATKMTYPLFLSHNESGVPLVLVRCCMDDFCEFDGGQRFASVPIFQDKQGLLLD